VSRKDSDSIDAISSNSRSIPPELRQSLPAPGTTDPAAKSIDDLLQEHKADAISRPLPASISDRLELLERIGEGGMSTVYKARHLVMGKVFAVKILNPHLTAKPQSLLRFQQEAKAAASLSHPNVITVHDCGVHDNHAFLIMDYLDGKSLGDVIDVEGKIPPERAIPIFIQTCDALGHAHLNSVIHRDLKPSNIMLLNDANHDDFVKIVDFGIAKLLDASEVDEKSHQNLTQTGDVFGSPLYMSPEQCTGQKLDKRSDIYSMGCLMYETLTGKPPLIGANVLETMHKQLNDTAAPIVDDKSQNTLLKRLNAIITKCLAKDRKARYQDMAELRNDLIMARDEPDGRWRAMSLAGKVQKTAKRKGRMSPLVLPAVATVVISSLLLAIARTSSEAMGRFKSYDNRSIWVFMPPNEPRSATFLEEKAALEKALKTISNDSKNPKYLEALENLARKCRKNGDWSDAALYYSKSITFMNEQAIPKLTDLMKAHSLLGICLMHQGLLKDARDEFSQSLSIFERAAIRINLDLPPLTFKEVAESLAGMLDDAETDSLKLIEIQTKMLKDKATPELDLQHMSAEKIFCSRFELADLYRRRGTKASLAKAEQQYRDTRTEFQNWFDPANLEKERAHEKLRAKEKTHNLVNQNGKAGESTANGVAQYPMHDTSEGAKWDILARADFGLALCQLRRGAYEEAERSLNGDDILKYPGALSEARQAVEKNAMAPEMEKDMRVIYLGVLWHTNPLRAALESISNSELGQQAM
jgi:serine/threonine protein kinase/tetratricopeptide (TPR) repeat protein